MNKEQRKRVYDVFAVSILIFGELVYFWNVIVGGKTLGMGSDGLLIDLMLEHWHDVFRGELSFATLRMYFPETGTIGYSDILLGPGVLFSLARTCGAGIYEALNIALILLHAIGVIFFYQTLRCLGCSRRSSLLGMQLSFWSCSFSQLTWHLQFFSLSFIAVAFYGVVSLWKRKEQTMRARFPYLILTSIGVGLTFLSSFYAAYMMSLLVGLTLVLWLVRCAVRKRMDLKKWAGVFLQFRKELLIGGLLQLPWLILLFWIYLPVYRQLGNYDPDLTLSLAPLPTDLFRTMSYAPLESWLRSVIPFPVDAKYQEFAENAWFERSSAWPVVATLLLIGFILYMVWRKEKEKRSLQLCFWGAISMFCIILLGCRYGTFCPWAHILSRIVPGAGAIRVTGRCLGLYVLPLAVCLCVWINELEKTEIRNGLKLVIEGSLFLMLGITSICKRYIRDDTEYYTQIVEACEQPPADCEVMVLCSASPQVVYTPEIQLIAWMIADRFQIMTINGYTGNYPNGWKLLNCSQDRYLGKVEAWLEEKQYTDTEKIYVYIPEENQWIAYKECMNQKE